MPSKEAIKRHKSKQQGYDYLADKYEKYKWAWAKALTIIPKIKRYESISSVTIVSDRSRLIDLENLWGGSKPIRDTLERRGWVYNDSPKWSELQVSQRKVKRGEEKTWVKIVLDRPNT